MENCDRPAFHAKCAWFKCNVRALEVAPVNRLKQRTDLVYKYQDVRRNRQIWQLEAANRRSQCALSTLAIDTAIWQLFRCAQTSAYERLQPPPSLQTPPPTPRRHYRRSTLAADLSGVHHLTNFGFFLSRDGVRGTCSTDFECHLPQLDLVRLNRLATRPAMSCFFVCSRS